MPGIARDNRQVMFHCGCGNNCIHGADRFAALLHQRGKRSPLSRNRPRNWQEILPKPRIQICLKPPFQLRAFPAGREKINSLTNFSERQHAGKEKFWAVPDQPDSTHLRTLSSGGTVLRPNSEMMLVSSRKPLTTQRAAQSPAVFRGSNQTRRRETPGEILPGSFVVRLPGPGSRHGISRAKHKGPA
jgi:hypothetical protein